MKTVKTSELTGAALDFAVAECEGKRPAMGGAFGGIVFADTGRNGGRMEYSPSVNWAQGGRIIERERINTVFCGKADTCWTARMPTLPRVSPEYGPSPLVAALRCFVASKRGGTVSLPEDVFA